MISILTKIKIKRFAARILEPVIGLVLLLIILSLGVMIYQLVKSQSNVSAFIYAFAAVCGVICSLLWNLGRSPVFIEQNTADVHKLIYDASLMFLANTIILVVVSGWAYVVPTLEQTLIPEKMRGEIISISIAIVLLVTLVLFFYGVYKVYRFFKICISGDK